MSTHSKFGNQPFGVHPKYMGQHEESVMAQRSTRLVPVTLFVGINGASTNIVNSP